MRKPSSAISTKTRDRFKKIRDTKGTVHAKRGTIKDRHGKDLPEEVARIHKRTEHKIFTAQIITMV